ncbi:sulfotransferase domain-containing protein [Almyronema epifaneia]|uniref:Sulfotransferase domain-containing protein n=1 Tax=Almyronema epifaneia S1 TaxID=2991925 RepID=A0ABW6ICU6_9CYAN
MVSYPKSGNTWLRFLVANLKSQADVDVSFANIESLVPDIYRNSNQQLLSLPQPRILKSHECYQARYPRVIYIVRDPRDVAISYYHHLVKARKLEQSDMIEAWLPDFIAGKFHPQFGTWATHVESWRKGTLGASNFLLVKYEDLLENPVEVLGEVARFLSIPPEQARLEKAIELSRADRMRQLEIEENWQPFAGNMRQDMRFVRAAIAGDWQNHLSTIAVETIETAWRSPMNALGYL